MDRWHERFRLEWDREEHINILEMKALRHALQHQHPVPGLPTTPFALPWDADSMVCIRAVERGRKRKNEKKKIERENKRDRKGRKLKI